MRFIEVSPKKVGNDIIAIENGKEYKFSHKVKVRNRPFRDWNGDILKFNSRVECLGWCTTRNELMDIVHF